MGYAKVVKVSDHEVRFEHQLDQDGAPYAEDVILKLDPSVDASRLAYYAEQDGKVGVLSWGFSPAEGVSSDVRFPSDAPDPDADDGSPEPDPEASEG